MHNVFHFFWFHCGVHAHMAMLLLHLSDVVLFLSAGKTGTYFRTQLREQHVQVATSKVKPINAVCQTISKQLVHFLELFAFRHVTSRFFERRWRALLDYVSCLLLRSSDLGVVRDDLARVGHDLQATPVEESVLVTIEQLAEISLSCLLVALPCGCDTHLRTDMTGTSHSCRASLSPPWRGNNVFVCDLRFTPGVQNHPRLSQPLLLRLSQLLHAARPLRQRAPQLQRWRLSPERQPSQPFLLPVRLQHALFLFLASPSGRRSEFRRFSQLLWTLLARSKRAPAILELLVTPMLIRGCHSVRGQSLVLRVGSCARTLLTSEICHLAFCSCRRPSWAAVTGCWSSSFRSLIIELRASRRVHPCAWWSNLPCPPFA